MKRSRRSSLPPLRRCRACGDEFVTRNVTHSCGVSSIEQHLEC